MYVSAIGSATAGAWISSVPRIRNNKRTEGSCINPFSPDGACANPLLDLVTLSLESMQYTGEVATPSLIFNNQVLDPFMFPIFDDPNLSQKIKVISKDKIFENIEY